MRKRKHLVGTLAVAAVALAASAAPAFTADSGTLTVSITAQAPAAPCLTVTPGSVDFGTLPFSETTAISEGNASITVNNCGTAAQNLLGSTTDATGPGGSWTPLPGNGVIDPCTASNRFYLRLTPVPGVFLYLTGTAAPVLASLGGNPAVFPAGDARLFRLSLLMPCTGSNGAGVTKTLSVTLTSTVA